jgi:TatA/E family protein of Tat protein translocase
VFLFSSQGMLVILVIALLLFGPEKLPELGRTIGRFMNEFKRAQESVEMTIRAEMDRPDADNEAVAPKGETAMASTASEFDVEDEEEEDEE